MPVVFADEVQTIQLCKPWEHFANEPDIQIRVAEDSRRIAESTGAVSDVIRFTELMQNLFGTNNESPSVRLFAATELRKLVSGLSPANVAHRSAARQVLRRVEFLEAGLRGIQNLPNNSDKAAATRLFNRLMIRLTVDVEYAWREVHGNLARRLLHELEKRFSAVHASVMPVVYRHYGDSNLRLILPECVATTIVGRTRTNAGQIADYVLGAWVTGSQQSNVKPVADIIPCRSSAMWRVIAYGAATSTTRGVKGPVAVHTQGHHHFTMQRIFASGGGSVTLFRPTISVNANNRTTGVTTELDDVPIVRGIVQSAATLQATQKKPQAEAIAARKLADKALPRFQRESDRRFGALNRFLCRTAYFRRRYVGRAPEYESYSTDTHLYSHSLTRSNISFAGTAPVPYPLPNNTLTVQIHESFVNSLIDGLETYGEQAVACLLVQLQEKYPNDDAGELLSRIEAYVEDGVEVLDDVIPLGGDELQGFIRNYLAHGAVQKLRETLRDRLEDQSTIPQIQFRHCDALRVRVEEGKLIVLVNAPPRKAGSRAATEIPLTLALQDGRIRIQELEEHVKRLVKLIERLNAAAQRNIPAAEIEVAVNNLLNKLTADTLIKRPEDIELRFVNVQLTEGWITLEIEVRQLTDAEIAANKQFRQEQEQQRLLRRQQRPEELKQVFRRLNDWLWQGVNCP